MECNGWVPMVVERKVYGTSRNYSSVLSGNIQKRGFDELCKISMDWRNHPEMEHNRNWLRVQILQITRRVTQDTLFASYVESLLFQTAASKEEYMNLETLNQRVRSVFDFSRAYVTGSNSVLKGGQSGPSNVHDLPCFPDDGSSILPVANMDVHSNLPVYGGGSYLDANTRSTSNYFPHQHTNNCNTDILRHTKRRKIISGFPNHFPVWESCLEPKDIWEYQPQMLDSYSGVSLNNDQSFDQWNNQLVQPYSSQIPSEVQQQPQFPLSCMSIHSEGNGEELKNPMFHSTGIRGINNKEAVDILGQILEDPSLESHDVMDNNSNDLKEFVVSLKSRKRTLDMDPFATDGEVMQGKAEFDHGITLNSNLPTLTKDVFPTDEEDMQDPNEFLKNILKEVFETTTDQETQTKSSNTTVNEIGGDKSMEIDIGSSSIMHALISKVPVPIDVEDKHDIIGFNQMEKVKRKVTESKADQEKQLKSPNTTVDVVSLIDFFTHDQITEHINSLRKEPLQITTEDGTGIDANTCQLCERENLYFAPVPILCICCGFSIGRRKTYFCRKDEEFDAERCFCSHCYNISKGGCIVFNGTSVSKENLEKKKNDEVLEEPWVECNKCKRWQHQVCALYNSKRDLDCSAEYICGVCRLKEIENGVRVPSQKVTVYSAKELPRTMLSDHLEKRLLKRLMEVRLDGGKLEGSENLDKVLAENNISIREVLSVDKQLKVKKQFLDIIPKKNYPAEFSYRSRVILLFQKIDGADICIFGLYVQEFGSECGNPNQRCVYISYLDSVKYFRPERVMVEGGALRTFVYHEILIGYLDFCKKRGFSTCYIWSCPPSKRDDYILYCHPKEQKTPNNDKLRSWYLSMLKKATEEKIVVGLTNIYDHFFVPTEKRGSKVTISRLPYFDGDFWCGSAMEKARTIEKESGGNYEYMLKKKMSTRALNAMGHVNPSKDAAKDILVMHKLGQDILHTRENFIIAHLQYSCMHCREVIMSGKRWFCTKCKKFQECDRCHSSNKHTLKNGEVHPLRQAVVDDIPSNTKHNDTILEHGLFKDRNNFLSFCQKYQFQFDTLRQAKYSSMMILYHLSNPSPMNFGKCCSICCAHNVFQKCWKCVICPDCTICSACYKDRGAHCHEHKLTQNEHKSTQNEHKLAGNNSTPQFGNQDSYGKMILKQEEFLKYVSQLRNQESEMMLKREMILRHASQCLATNAKPCSNTSCWPFKKLFSHGKKCTTRIDGGCEPCKRIWIMLISHSMDCKVFECRIPNCSELKKLLEYRGMR